MNQFFIICTLACCVLAISACSNSKPNPPQADISENATKEDTSIPQTDIQPEKGTPVADNAPPKHEPCVVPLTSNPIPKEKQRPFIVTYETYDSDVKIRILVRHDYDALKNLYYPLDIEYDCNMDGVYEKRLTPDSLAKDVFCYYEESGLHQIAMRGDIPPLTLDYITDYTDDNDVEHYNLISVDQWGDIRWKDMTELLAFHGKYNPKTRSNHYPILKAKDTPDLHDVCEMTGMFAKNEEFNAPIGSWDVSHVEDMTGLFNGCSKFNQDITQWNVSNVKEMTSMFANCISFDQDISSWDISSLVYVFGMFDSKDPKITICPKCEAFRQKVLEKNNHLPPEQKKLNFNYIYNY